MYPDEVQSRGCSLEFQKQACLHGQSFVHHSTQAGLWLRIESWLSAVSKAGVKVSHKTCQQVINQLSFADTSQEEADRFRVELFAHLTAVEGLRLGTEEALRAHAKRAQKEHLAADKARYQEWLEGAMVKGMRPLYKAIRSQKLVLVRPFRDKEAALRPYLRYEQWAHIWNSRFPRWSP